MSHWRTADSVSALLKRFIPKTLSSHSDKLWIYAKKHSNGDVRTAMHSCRGALPSPVGANVAMQKIDHNQCLRLTLPSASFFFGQIFTYVNAHSKASRQHETFISNRTQRPDHPHHPTKQRKRETLV